jgi:hypothetical protein
VFIFFCWLKVRLFRLKLAGFFLFLRKFRCVAVWRASAEFVRVLKLEQHRMEDEAPGLRHPRPSEDVLLVISRLVRLLDGAGHVWTEDERAAVMGAVRRLGGGDLRMWRL